jgi:hypothetical protein
VTQGWHRRLRNKQQSYAGDKDEDEYAEVEYLYDDEADKDNNDFNQPDNPSGKPLSAAPVANLAKICRDTRVAQKTRRQVTGKRPLQPETDRACLICGQVLAKVSNLVRHMRVKHGMLKGANGDYYQT